MNNYYLEVCLREISHNVVQLMLKIPYWRKTIIVIMNNKKVCSGKNKDLKNSLKTQDLEVKNKSPSLVVNNIIYYLELLVITVKRTSTRYPGLYKLNLKMQITEFLFSNLKTWLRFSIICSVLYKVFCVHTSKKSKTLGHNNILVFHDFSVDFILWWILSLNLHNSDIVNRSQKYNFVR